MRLPFDPAELAMLEDNGFFGVTDDMKEAIAEELISRGIEIITDDDLAEACWTRGVDPANLKPKDIREICQYLEHLR